MTTTIDIKGYRFGMDNYLKENLDLFLNKAVPNKWDGLFIVFGGEGTGKTTFISQSALYLDHNYNLNACVFTPKQFEEAIDKLPDESSIHWDEAITGANASQHASSIQQSIISKLTQIRKKRLKIFLAFPYLYMLRQYFLQRCIAGIYVYAKDFDDRGYCYFYSQPELIQLHWFMKERFQYNPNLAINKSPMSFWFKFKDVLCLDEETYDKKKEEARVNENERINKNVWKDRFIKAYHKLYKSGVTLTQIAKDTGMSKSYLSEVIRSCPVDT